MNKENTNGIYIEIFQNEHQYSCKLHITIQEKIPTHAVGIFDWIPMPIL